MKKITILLFFCLISLSLFADIVLPESKYVVKNVDEWSGFEWIADDRTEFSKKKAMGLLSIPHPIIANHYETSKDEIGKDGGVFFAVNECTGMDFVFQLSPARVMAIKETISEVKAYINAHIKEVNPNEKFNMIKKSDSQDNRTGEFQFKYQYKTTNGKLVTGYVMSIYYKKETLVNLISEFTDEVGRNKAFEAFSNFKSDFKLKKDINI